MLILEIYTVLSEPTTHNLSLEIEKSQRHLINLRITVSLVFQVMLPCMLYTGIHCNRCSSTIKWLLLTRILLSAAEVFHVTPTLPATQPCTPPCHTLDQYAQNTSLIENHYANVVILSFLSGEHNLSQNFSFSGFNHLSLYMQGQNLSIDNIHEGGVVNLNSKSQIVLANFIQLKICNLTLISSDYSGITISISHTEEVVLWRLKLSCVTFVKQVQLIDINNCIGVRSSLQFRETSNISVRNSNMSGSFHGLYLNQSGICLTDSPKNITSSTLATHLSIHNTQIVNYMTGLDSAINLVNISITNTQFKENKNGVSVINSQGAIALNNTQFWNSGIYINRSREIKITNARLNGNKYTYSGIHIAHSNKIAITRMSISTQALYAVFITHSTELKLINVQFEQVLWHNNGVYIYSSKNISVSSMQLLRCNYGVVINDSQDISISNTQVFECSYGVFINDSKDISISNTQVFECSYFGLVLRNTSIKTNILNSHIVNNRLGIFNIGSKQVCIENTVINMNTIGFGISDIFGKSGPSFVTNCTFFSNKLGGLVLVNTKGKLELQDCSFYENRGTPIIAYQSTFELMGETVFSNNTSERGGGLALYNSTVTFGPRSNIHFINNTAYEFGGAIYIVSLPSIHSLLINFESVKNLDIQNIRATKSLLQESCFYSVNKASQTKVTFIGNRAQLGGWDIYGPTLYTPECSLQNNSLFVFENSELITGTGLQITSDPSRVCFCVNNVPQCENKSLIVLSKTVYPGETFTVPAVLTGYNFGRVAGSVHINTLEQNYRELISDSQHVQTVDLLNCTNLAFTVQYSTKPVILTLTTQEQIIPQELNVSIDNTNTSVCAANSWRPCTALLTTPVYVKVTMEGCPVGFKLNKTGMCDCDYPLANLNNFGISLACTIQNQAGYIQRQGTVWVGTDANNNSTDLYYWHIFCPRDYCKSSSINVDLRHPDVQCSHHRTGIMCGSCLTGYSLQLGNNNCAQCDNNRIALLIGFSILGILLVVLISTLDLTVASGTINGLIFYANVVWRNDVIFFPFRYKGDTSFYLITLPIAWLNLDFGIETCFSAKLDQLTKIGLQFVFPVYIWCIAGLIIIVCHYSTRATKLFGNNSVAVLATLFLLSYGKLFKNITDVFTHANVMDSNGTTHVVWNQDGNIQYNAPGHIFLMVLALVFLLFFILPFTLLLLLVPFLMVKSDHRLLHWINRLTPFFDAYYGPFKYKKKYQVWTGILLVSRVVLLAVFALTLTAHPNANILLMTIIAALLGTYTSLVGLLYKVWYVSLLETLYLLNLVILGSAFLFNTHPHGISDNPKVDLVPTISLCVALFQFVCTLIAHIVKRFLVFGNKVCPTRKLEPFMIAMKEKDNKKESENMMHSSKFREPLLSESL